MHDIQVQEMMHILASSIKHHGALTKYNQGERKIYLIDKLIEC